MRKILKNEQGYSLLLAIGVLLIFTILGLSLVTLTSNGITKNNTRQDIVQAQDLSDKGIDFVVKDIQKHLENGVKQGMTSDRFTALLNDTLGTLTLKCTQNNGIDISAEKNNKTNVCVEKIETFSTEDKDKYKRIVTFKSTGKANNKDQITRSKVVFGTDVIPEQLHYAVSSNDEGSVYLYGGIDVTGDIKTAKDLVIHNKAIYYKTIGQTILWKDSVYPRLKADSKSISPKVILPESGNLYITKSVSHLNTESDLLNLNVSNHKGSYTEFGATDSSLTNLTRSTFFDSSNVSTLTKKVESDKVLITEKISNLYSSGIHSKFYNGSLSITNSNKEEINLPKDSTVLIGSKKNCTSSSQGNCNGGKYERGTGNFTISDSTVNLSGQYFVNGNLSITKSTVNSDAIIYVDGNVNIAESLLNGLGQNGTLILFATGNIKLSNISEFSETPSKLKGFFYSQSALLMFGSYSNIQLQGGISAKNVILTAVRGKFPWWEETDSAEEQAKLVDHDKNPNTPPIPEKNSRLSIIYDQDLVEAYTSFKHDGTGDYITKLNAPEIRERY